MEQILKISLVILCVSIVFICVDYMISLWFIFKKEDIKETNALIPFINIYHIFKIIDIPFYTIFIPLVNLVVLILIPYKLLKRYKQPKWMMNLSIFFPYVFMPYIAFSNKCIKPKDVKQSIKTLFELDGIENNLANNMEIPDLFFGENLDNIDILQNNQPISKTEAMIEKIEQNSIVDEYFFENEIVDEELENKNSNEIPVVNENIDEIIEIFDQEENGLLTSSIDSMDKKLEEDNNIQHINNAEYKEYEMENASNEAIAFGGTNKEEDTSHAKKDELKCHRCGSSLVGANGYCPGCGLKL